MTEIFDVGKQEEMLIRSSSYLNRELAIDIDLITGDITGNTISLYSIKPLEGYKKQGDIYVKEIALDDPDIGKHKGFLTDVNAHPYPEENTFSGPPNFIEEKIITTAPSAQETRIFGVNGSYVYAASPELIGKFNPKWYERCKKEESFTVEGPLDSAIVHEGAHVAMNPYGKILEPKHVGLVSDNSDDKPRSVREAFAFLPEIRFLREFYPQLEENWHEWRATNPDPVYREAQQLLLKRPDDVAAMVDFVRNENRKNKA